MSSLLSTVLVAACGTSCGQSADEVQDVDGFNNPPAPMSEESQQVANDQLPENPPPDGPQPAEPSLSTAPSSMSEGSEQVADEKLPEDPPPDDPQLAEPPISIAGRWGMFLFEDPVAIELVQEGSTLSGLACDAGLPDDDAPASAVDEWCGPLMGTVNGKRIAFRAEFGIGVELAVAVTVSDDGTRMAGQFSFGAGWSRPMAWLRFPADRRNLETNEGTDTAYAPLTGGYQLRLLEASGGATDFRQDRDYMFGVSSRGIYGELGSFWHTEIPESDGDEHIVIGPVTPTDPALPVSLELHHNGFLTGVTAVMASGDRYVFEVIRD